MTENGKPLVSVLVPAYNHEAYVKDAILSVIKQSYGFKNIQLIVTDDCSTDNTPTILHKLEDKFKFKLILHKQNMGICSTLNEMIALSSGVYITGIASDDTMVLNRIENQINILTRNPNVDVLAGDFILIDKHGNILSDYKKEPLDTLISYSFDDIFLKQKPGFAAGTVIYKSDLFKRIGGYDPDYKVEDYDFWLKAAENNASIVKCNRPFLNYRVHNNSVSSNVELINNEVFKILAKYKDHPKYSQALQNREILNLSKLIFIDKIQVIQRMIRNPMLLLNRKIIRILVMLILPDFLLKRKIPEFYYRNAAK